MYEPTEQENTELINALLEHGFTLVEEEYVNRFNQTFLRTTCKF